MDPSLDYLMASFVPLMIKLGIVAYGEDPPPVLKVTSRGAAPAGGGSIDFSLPHCEGADTTGIDRLWQGEKSARHRRQLPYSFIIGGESGTFCQGGDTLFVARYLALMSIPAAAKGGSSKKVEIQVDVDPAPVSVCCSLPPQRRAYV